MFLITGFEYSIPYSFELGLIQLFQDDNSELGISILERIDDVLDLKIKESLVFCLRADEHSKGIVLRIS